MLQGQVISLGIRLGRGLVLILYIGQLLIAVRKDLKQYIVPYFRAARYDEPSPVSSYSTASPAGSRTFLNPSSVLSLPPITSIATSIATAGISSSCVVADRTMSAIKTTESVVMASARRFRILVQFASE